MGRVLKSRILLQINNPRNQTKNRNPESIGTQISDFKDNLVLDHNSESGNRVKVVKFFHYRLFLAC